MGQYYVIIISLKVTINLCLKKNVSERSLMIIFQYIFRIIKHKKRSTITLYGPLFKMQNADTLYDRLKIWFAECGHFVLLNTYKHA